MKDKIEEIKQLLKEVIGPDKPAPDYRTPYALKQKAKVALRHVEELEALILPLYKNCRIKEIDKPFVANVNKKGSKRYMMP